MKHLSLLAFLAVWLVVAPGTAATPSASLSQAISTDKATAAFVEVRALCTAEDGKLWQHSLCVPMMFVDRVSRQAVLNRPAKGAVKDGAIYRLVLPQDIAIANTSADFQGKRWSLVMWPLPTNAVKRDILFMHESYHSIQPALGLPGSSGLGNNGELDSRTGRIWMRAEFSALRTALRASGQRRRRALADALLFRAYRMSLWPHAAADERSLELNEGLAESTGIDASQRSTQARIDAAIQDIDNVENERSFVRAFPYATGPAYAELLDAVQPDWRRKVTPNFAYGKAAAVAYQLTFPRPDRTLAMAAIERYAGNKIIAQENARAKVTAARNARFGQALLNGPTLTLPLTKFSISFDPRQIYELAGHGSVYQTLKLGDAWGRLSVHDSGVALIASAFDRVTVPLQKAPSGTHLTGAGWSLDLNNGYRYQPDPQRKGSFIVTRAKP